MFDRVPQFCVNFLKDDPGSVIYFTNELTNTDQRIPEAVITGCVSLVLTIIKKVYFEAY